MEPSHSHTCTLHRFVIALSVYPVTITGGTVTFAESLEHCIQVEGWALNLRMKNCTHCRVSLLTTKFLKTCRNQS